MTLSFVWEGITIAISHEPNWLNTDYDHIEVRAGEKLPITETGYRSHFIARAELELFDGAEDFVWQWLDKSAMSKDWQKYLRDSRQLSLF